MYWRRKRLKNMHGGNGFPFFLKIDSKIVVAMFALQGKVSADIATTL